MTIDRNLITEANEGTFSLGVDAKDASGKGSYSIPISTKYIFVKKPEPKAKPANPGDKFGGVNAEEEVAVDPGSALEPVGNKTLSPEEEAALNTKVEATVDLLTDTLGGDDTESAVEDETEEPAEVKEEPDEITSVGVTSLATNSTSSSSTASEPKKAETAKKEKAKPKAKKRPKTAKPSGWFKRNVRSFKKKLRKFGGDYMTMLARMKPAGQADVKPEEIPYLGCYIKSINQLG